MNLEYEKLLKEFFHILFSKSKNTKKYIRKIERPGKKTQYIYKNDIKLKQPGGKETRNTLQSENKKLLKKYPAFFKKKEVLQSLQKYKSFLKKNNKSLNGTGITKLEAFVIYHYSTYRGYSELNDNLRKKNPNPYTKQYSEL
ncbi:MAG: hypothetical protein KDK36_08080, partial [Leptospiraceae bacterium]|nr:hypothetical protein [Leptospiraceae bacterium]